MTQPLAELLPEPEALLALEPEELAGYLLEHLNSMAESELRHLNRYNFSLDHTFQGYPQEHREAISRAFMEAWVWLEHEGLIAPKPGAQGEWAFITRRGRTLKGRVDFEAFRKSNILPKDLLHPIIAQKVWSSFIRGEYDTAVFQAFKEIEVAVRSAGGFDASDIGVSLIRKAFDAESGPLKDQSLPKQEREAVAHLFAGAIGSYKNPSSHRHVQISDPVEAVELIVLASHLMRIVDLRTPSVVSAEVSTSSTTTATK